MILTILGLLSCIPTPNPKIAASIQPCHSSNGMALSFVAQGAVISPSSLLAMQTSKCAPHAVPGACCPQWRNFQGIQWGTAREGSRKVHLCKAACLPMWITIHSLHYHPFLSKKSGGIYGCLLYFTFITRHWMGWACKTTIPPPPIISLNVIAELGRNCLWVSRMKGLQWLSG